MTKCAPLLVWVLLASGLVALGHPVSNSAGLSQNASEGRPPEVRAPNPGTLDAYRSQSAYQYEDHAHRSESIGARLWRWFRKTVLAPITADGYENLTRAALAVIAVSVLAVALIRLLRMEKTSMTSSRRPKRAGTEMEEVGIHERDLQREAEQAEEAGDFRLAMRLRFLSVLQDLDRRSMITFSPEKTNRTYLRELGSGPLRVELGRLVRLFESTWYGDYALSPEQYEQACRSFRRFQDGMLEATP